MRALPCCTVSPEGLAEDTGRVPNILGLGFAAAVYPQLLAVVVVILTRSGPKRLLWTCYLAGFWTSAALGVMILLVFRDRGSVAGSTSHRLGASVFLLVGVIAVVIAILMPTERGRRLVASGPPRRLGSRGRRRRSGFIDRQKWRANRALERGSLPIAVAVGMVLGLPGPFDLLALGRIARGGYAVLGAILMIIAFNLVKFLLIEIPIASYAVDPDGTAARVDRFSAWMKAQKMTLIAVVVGVIGVVLIARGVSRLG